MFSLMILVTLLNKVLLSESTPHLTSVTYVRTNYTICGPQRLSPGWTDSSRLSCAVTCNQQQLIPCQSFMYSDVTNRCTPSGEVNSQFSLPTSDEGDLYLCDNCQTNSTFSVISDGTTSANIAYFTSPLFYLDAVNACLSLNSYLYVANTMDKWRLLNLTIIPDYTWIGLDDLAVEGKYVWADSGLEIDPVLNASIFMAGQPDNLNGIEDCVHFWPGKEGLNDADCDTLMNYICEKPLCS